MDKILDIIEIIAYEKGLQMETIQNIIKEEILKFAKENIDENKNFILNFDKKDKNIKLFYKLKVVENNKENLDSNKEISLEKAASIGNVNIGDEMLFEVNIDELNTNRSIISSMLKDIENTIERNIENQTFENLKNSVGKIINGMVVYIDKKTEDSIIEIDSAKAKLPRKNRIKGEKFEVGENVSCILKNIFIDKKYNLQIELSRTTPKFLEELLTLEVPEISDGEVSIIKCARIPGVRAKVAVQSNSPKVDAVGASVGIKGVRINAVSKKLNGENIDCIEYSSIPEVFIANVLSPAKIKSVKIENSKAIVSIHSEQKAKIIGKDGVNIRLASMILGMEIELNDIGAENASYKAESKTTTNKENSEEIFKSLFKS